MIRSVAVAAVRAGRAPALAFSRRSSFDIAHQVVLGGQTIQRATVVVPLAEKLESGELQFSCAAFASVIAAAFGALSHSPAQCADNNSGKKRVAGTLEGFVRSKPKLDDLDRAAMFAPITASTARVRQPPLPPASVGEGGSAATMDEGSASAMNMSDISTYVACFSLNAHT